MQINFRKFKTVMHNASIYIFFILSILLQINTLFAQDYFNITFQFNDYAEFSRDILTRNNGNLINLSGGSGGAFPNNSGIILRELNENGDLIWENNIVNDSTSFFGNWEHISHLVQDSIIVIFGTAETNNPFKQFPYFIKYNLNIQSIMNIKYFDQLALDTSVGSSIVNSDGYLYGSGRVILPSGGLNQDLFLMKIDLDGNVIWDHTYDLAINSFEDVNEIENFNGNLVLSGRADTGPTTEAFLMTIDTAGNFIENVFPVPFGSNGIIKTEIFNNNIYFVTETEIAQNDSTIQYIAKFDDNLNLIWERKVQKTKKFKINFRDIEILNSELIIVANILGAPEYTNNRTWSYGCSYDLDGNLNWEHVYVFDQNYTHHLDDIEVASNGDLIFMGTVFTNSYPLMQQMWLFRTDSEGCGIVQDTCYSTLEEYFGIDTLVSLNDDFSLLEGLNLQVQGNPFKENLNFSVSSLDLDEMHYEVTNLNGKLVAFNTIQNSNSINSSAWEAGIYFLNIYQNNRLVSKEKVVKL